jgi:hypothetical protein
VAALPSALTASRARVTARRTSALLATSDVALRVSRPALRAAAR